MNPVVRAIVLAPPLLALAGCASGTMLSNRHLGHASVMATSADVRLVTATPIPPNTEEFVRPTQIVCSEPSPDVAKIVSDAFGGANAFGFKGKTPNVPTDADIHTTMALSHAYAEGVAQMTERLATIQLLRDGLFRACEAYSNGAISATTYAMVSRYDKTMVTLLIGELAAGNFGRSLAALGGTTTAESSAAQTLSDLHDQQRDVKSDISRKESRKQDLEDQLNALPQNDPSTAAQASSLKKQITELDQEISQSKSDSKHIQDKIDEQQNASSKAGASTNFAAAGAIAHTGPEAAAAVAANLVQIQANYLNDHNVDAIKIACLSSLGRAEEMSYRQSSMLEFCDKLVTTLIRNEKQVMDIRASQRLEPTEGAVKELVVPAPHAAGPYFVPAKDNVQCVGECKARAK